MRKFLTLALLALFGLPLVSPLLALGQDTGTAVHACCRRGGSHHCQESAAPATDGTQLNAEHMRCPYSQGSMVVATIDLLGFAPSTSLLTSLASHPNGVAQAESLRRIARERTRQKRGPPTSSSL